MNSETVRLKRAFRRIAYTTKTVEEDGEVKTVLVRRPRTVSLREWMAEQARKGDSGAGRWLDAKKPDAKKGAR